MVTSYPARQRTGSRNKDAVNPVFLEAEAKVLEWLVAEGHDVQDARPQRTYYDFALGNLWTVDVKCDQWMQTTGRVAWELYLETRGVLRESWGMDARLDYVAFVAPHIWKLVLVDTEAVRDLIAKQEKGFNLPKSGELVAFSKEGNDQRTGKGVALSIDYLRRHGCIKKEAQLGLDAEEGPE